MYAPVGAGRSSSVARRLAALWWRLFFAMLLVVVAPMARAETTVTATLRSASCTVSTPGIPGSTRLVPCFDEGGLSLVLAPDERLDVHATYSYLYADDGLTFASGAATVLCNGAPCDRFPGASGYEFGELAVGVRGRTYPVYLPLTSGPDILSGVVGFIEIVYPIGTAYTIGLEFVANTVTVSATPVPEPAMWLLMALALPLMAGSALHRRSRSA